MDLYHTPDTIKYIASLLQFKDLTNFASMNKLFRDIISEIWLDVCHFKQEYNVSGAYHITNVTECETLPSYKNLKSIRFDHQFNSIPYNIPPTVTLIDFGFEFDQPIDGCIHQGVTHLILGHKFNQILTDCIPNSVTHLYLSNHFNMMVTNWVPNSVTHLIFGYKYNQFIKYQLPNSITHLVFGHDYNQPIFKHILPASLTHLRFGWCFNQSIEHLPPSITHLALGHDFNQPIQGQIPKNTIQLRFGASFNQPIDNNIPYSVSRLELGIDFDINYYKFIPNTITHLIHLIHPYNDEECYINSNCVIIHKTRRRVKFRFHSDNKITDNWYNEIRSVLRF